MDIHLRVTIDLSERTIDFIKGVMAERNTAECGSEPMSGKNLFEEIKAEVEKFVKRGNSADIKVLLDHFDVMRVSQLEPEKFGKFHAALIRYGNGEPLEKIINDLVK